MSNLTSPVFSGVFRCGWKLLMVSLAALSVAMVVASPGFAAIDSVGESEMNFVTVMQISEEIS